MEPNGRGAYGTEWAGAYGFLMHCGILDNLPAINTLQMRAGWDAEVLMERGEQTVLNMNGSKVFETLWLLSNKNNKDIGSL